MSDLQWGLLAVGVLVVGAVYLYNLLLERGYRRRMQRAFAAAHEDVLLKSGVQSARSDGRLEPQLVADAAPGATQAAAAAAPGEPFEERDELLDYVAEIRADAPIPDAHVAELIGKVAASGKPVRVLGRAAGGQWTDLVRGKAGGCRELRVSLQLVNRAGTVHPAQLSSFCDAVRTCAERAGAQAQCPDARAALERARALDAICAEVDLAVGINIVAADDAAFAGPAIRAAAEEVGFKLEPDGLFHYRNQQRQTLFTLDNHEPAPFLPESIKTLSTRGVTVLMDVPRIAGASAVLERMFQAAATLAERLGGRLVDDNRAPLSEAGMARIQAQVQDIHSRMEQQGIPAGGARALRLFS
jgi:hypothetical protein